MKRLVVVATVGLFLAGCAGVARADGNTPEIGISGSFSYHEDFNAPTNAALAAGTLNQLSYPNNEPGRNSFNIDLVELTAHGQATDSVGYEASIFFGDLAPGSGDSGNSSSGLSNVGLNTANVSFPVGTLFGPLKVTLGRRATDIGYEVIQPWGNAHISRSFVWNAQPINNDGAFVSYDGGAWSGTIGVANGYTVAQTTGASNDTNFNKALMANFKFGIAGWDVSVAGTHSREINSADLSVINVIVQGDLGPIQAAVEYNYLDHELGTVAGGSASLLANVAGGDVEADTGTLYLGQDFSCCWGWDFRFEYDDIDTSSTSLGPPIIASTELWGATLTGTWHVAEGTDLRLEYRHNEASGAGVGGNIFADDSSSGFDDSQDTLALQLVVF